MRKTLLCLTLCFLSFSISNAQKRAVRPEGSNQELPFTPGVWSGDFLFLSGALGSDPKTGIYPDDIEKQTELACGNLGTVLLEAGLGFEDVVSVNVYLSDIRYYEAMNEVYARFFDGQFPARATVEASLAIPGALVEIGMVAVKPTIEKKWIRPEGWPLPSAPYTWGVLAEDTLFVSGLIGINPKDGSSSPEFTWQTRRVFDNLGAILNAAGMDFEDLVSTKVFLSDSRDFQAMNDVYASYLKESPPVRATVQARLANPRLKIELQSVAVRRGKQVIGERPPGRPFASSVKGAELLYVAGMVGRGPDGFAPGDIKAQTRQTLENLRTALKGAGFAFNDVVDVTVYLSDPRFYADMNEVYGKTMSPDFPARATVGTPLMSPQALVEIMMTAYRQE